jgi:hypothetical protein
LYYHLPMEANIALGVTGLLSSAFTMWYTSKVMEDEERRLLSADGLNSMFETTYAGQVVIERVYTCALLVGVFI